jgi:hypothetical protein
MAETSRSKRSFFYEASKILAFFLVFYVLETQIIQVERTFSGQTGGLAQAQAQARSDLGKTREYVDLALEDSSSELCSAREELERSVESLKLEREQLLGMIEELTNELAPDLQAKVEEGNRELSSLKDLTRSHASRIEELSHSFHRDATEMKRSMIYPTVQLRGNGTVGSGVLVYSERQPGFPGAPVYTTFALTAFHVVKEVLGEEPKQGKEIGTVEVLGQEGFRKKNLKVSACVVLFDGDRDTALLRLNTTRRFPYLARLMRQEALGSIDIFSPAYAVGCPLGNRPMPTLGEVSSRSKKVGKQTYWMLNAPTYFGNSGGGIYLASGYDLIGVSSMIYTYGKTRPTVVPHMGLFVPLASIYDWLGGEGYEFLLRSRPVPPQLREQLVFTREPPRPSPDPETRGPASRPTPAHAEPRSSASSP